jgi:hypothetical protein
MKRHTISTAFACVAVLALSMAPTAQAESGKCSLGRLAGDWAYTYTGTIFTRNGPLPLAAVGHFSVDAAGNTSGSQTRSVAGSSGVEDVSGISTVNKDCTGSATIDALVNGQVQRTAVLAVAFDSNMNHARAIFQSLTLPDGTNVPVVITIDYTRMVPRD